MSRQELEEYDELYSRNEAYRNSVEAHKESVSVKVEKLSDHRMLYAVKLQRLNLTAYQNAIRRQIRLLKELTDKTELCNHLGEIYEAYTNPKPKNGIVEAKSDKDSWIYQAEALNLWLDWHRPHCWIEEFNPRIQQASRDLPIWWRWLGEARAKWDEYYEGWNQYKAIETKPNEYELIKMSNVVCQKCNYTGKLFAHADMICPDCLSVLNVTENEPNVGEPYRGDL